ncbi:hypothetical protein FRAHR75_1390002 [Frankia sp. Hr75.2]|nr:hypothetical protein FRAHR75_1390002 [Frankia sp. Hr75.2]
MASVRQQNADRDVIQLPGDELRQFHPDFLELMDTNPIGMVPATQQASTAWMQMSFVYAVEHGYSFVAEGTFRNTDAVLADARFFATGRRGEKLTAPLPEGRHRHEVWVLALAVRAERSRLDAMYPLPGARRGARPLGLARVGPSLVRHDPHHGGRRRDEPTRPPSDRHQPDRRRPVRERPPGRRHPAAPADGRRSNPRRAGPPAASRRGRRLAGTPAGRRAPVRRHRSGHRDDSRGAGHRHHGRPDHHPDVEQRRRPAAARCTSDPERTEPGAPVGTRGPSSAAPRAPRPGLSTPHAAASPGRPDRPAPDGAANRTRPPSSTEPDGPHGRRRDPHKRPDLGRTTPRRPDPQ